MHIVDTCEIYLILSTYFPALRISQIISFLTRHTDPSSTHLEPSSLNLEISSPFIIGSVLIYVATFIRVWCYEALGRHFTFHLAILKKHKLVTTGPYKYVRHPSYVDATMFHVEAIISQAEEGSWIGEYIT